MAVAEVSETHFAPIRAANLIARLARSAEDVDAAQALRYRVFYEEMDAIASAENFARKRDFDAFDSVCDHLLVINEDRADLPGGVIGTYRLLRRSVADRHDGFYSATEFDLTPLLKVDGEIMELGRSCVDPDNRTRPAMQLMWQAIAAYVFQYEIGLMFGCASMPGAVPAEQMLSLSYLYHFHRAPLALRPRALPHLYENMHRLSKEEIDVREAVAKLPPLLKGYLRLGGFVGDGAVVDPQFNTTDVCVVVKTDLVTDKYFKHYERSARSFAGG